MRKSLLLPFLVSVLVSAQAPTPAPAPAPIPAPPSGAAPVITFPETTFSFGKIAAHQQVTHSFKLTNTGKGTLNLKEVKASCGCTSVVAGKWALAPGESTEIQASFNSGTFQGIVRKSITVTSDDPATPIVNLHFDADVIPEPPPSVRSVAILDVERGSVKKSIMRLDSGDGSPVHVKDIKVQDAPYLSGVVHAEGTENFLEIQLDGRLIPKGKTSATDVLSVFSADEGKPSIPIKVQWELKPVIAASPAFVAMAGKAGEPLRATVRLQQIKGKPFRILEAKASNPLIKVDASKKASVHPEIHISMSPEAKVGSYLDEHVILTLDEPDQGELSIRVSAVIR